MTGSVSTAISRVSIDVASPDRSCGGGSRERGYQRARVLQLSSSDTSIAKAIDAVELARAAAA